MAFTKSGIAQGIPVFAKGMLAWVGCCVLLVSIAVSAQEAVELHIDNGDTSATIRLEARHILLREVLDGIAVQTGVPIHFDYVPMEFVSVNCSVVGVKALLECLLGADADLIFRYKDDGDTGQRQAEEIWILDSTFNQTANATAIAAECASLAQEAETAKNKSNQEAQEKARALQEDTERLLAQATVGDPEQRAQALAALASEPRPNAEQIRKTLVSALSDNSPEVRGQAVFGLSRLDGTQASSAIQAALHDSDVSVRLIALDSVGNDTALLTEALADSDAIVQQAAAAKLKEINGNADSD